MQIVSRKEGQHNATDGDRIRERRRARGSPEHKEVKRMGERSSTAEMEYVEVGSLRVYPTVQGTTQRYEILIPGLPDEVAILCIARVPRSYHRNIRSVCRSWRYLLRGKFFSKVRQELSLTEEWVYLWIQSGNAWRCFDPYLKQWWKLPMMPNDNRVPGHSAFASVGEKLFVIGGTLLNFHKTAADRRYIASKTVSYFDARSHRWRRAADLNIARAKCMTGVINNQLYVFGGYIERCNGYIEGLGNTTVTAEIYDPITDTWRFISSMKYRMEMCDSVVMGGKFYSILIDPAFDEGLDEDLDEGGLMYDPHTDKWEEMARGLWTWWGTKTTVLNGKLYSVGDEYYHGARILEGENYREVYDQIAFYDPIIDDWWLVDQLIERQPLEELTNGSERDLTLVMKDVELISFGGKLCIICVKKFEGDENAVTKICMVVLNVEDSTEIPKCLLDFKDDFKIELIDESLPIPPEIKRCQVIAF